MMNTYDAAANTICPNPFEAFAAAALKAMGITKPHEELMAREGMVTRCAAAEVYDEEGRRQARGEDDK